MPGSVYQGMVSLRLGMTPYFHIFPSLFALFLYNKVCVAPAPKLLLQKVRLPATTKELSDPSRIFTFQCPPVSVIAKLDAVRIPALWIAQVNVRLSAPIVTDHHALAPL